MKKITKLTKIFLVLMTFLSQVLPAFKVLADEIVTKPLTLTLNQVLDLENGFINHYELTYTSEGNDYVETETIDGVEVDKTYDIKLTTSFTYLNNVSTEENIETIEDVTGKTLNSEVSSYELAPISKYYNGVFNLNVAVFDGESKIYDTDISYNVDNCYVGLVGALNEGDVLPVSEEVSYDSTARYEVSDGTIYTQHLLLMPGELSPSGTYRIVYVDGTRSEVMTGIELSELMFDGSVTDLTGKLGGDYAYTDTITIEEVLGEEVVKTYTYNYNAIISYDGNSDDIFNSKYDNMLFRNGYLIVNAKGFESSISVPTINDIVNGVIDTDITVRIFDNNGNEFDLTDGSILNEEIGNNYQVVFTSGTDATYTVIVKGDNTFDNAFDTNDMLSMMNGYLAEEKMPSMDVIGEEELGTITFEDVMMINESLKENGDTSKNEEDNSNLSLVFGDIPSSVFVGDAFNVTVEVNSDNVLDYIDGVDGAISVSDNLRLDDIIFNDKLIGTFNDNYNFVAAGDALTSGNIVMTLVFTATNDGVGNISISGDTAKFLNINEFNTLVGEVVIERNISTNNDLISLNASVGNFDIAFDKDVTEYTLTVPYDTESVILSGALSDVNASVDGLIEYKLTEDRTVATITVTAEDGSIKTYTVYIVKGAKPVTTATPVTYYYSSNSYLKSLEIDGYDIDFDKEIYEYKISVSSDVTSLDIKAIAEDSKSRVEINGNEGFKKGENTVIITVTAEDGSTKEYKIVVDKAGDKKSAATEKEESSNTAEKVVIIILIVLVVLGLLYLIFKKDDEDEIVVKKDTQKKNDNNKTNNKNKK